MPVVGIVAVLQLWFMPGAPAASAQAVLAMLVTPAGSGLTTTTANCALAEPPPAGTLPTAREHGEPAPAPEHDQPPPPAQLVSAGTVSRSVTGPLSCVPLLTTLRLYTTVAPGVPVPLARLLARFRLT